jgi:hypothetical protein
VTTNNVDKLFNKCTRIIDLGEARINHVFIGICKRAQALYKLRLLQNNVKQLGILLFRS